MGLVDDIVTRDTVDSGRWLQMLASTIVGAIGFAVVTGVQTVILAPGRALEDAFGKIGGAIERGFSRYISEALAQWDQAWSTNVDLGVVQLPYALLIVLVTFLVVARLLTLVRDDG
jgi:Flp pilus assembly pilin Flp